MPDTPFDLKVTFLDETGNPFSDSVDLKAFWNYNVEDVKLTQKLYDDLAEPEPVNHIINVGERYASTWDESLLVEVILVSKHGEVVFRYEDESIGYAEDEDDFFDQGFMPASLSGWTNVLYSTSKKELFFDGVYDSKEEALDGLDEILDWTIIDTIEVKWQA